MKKNLSEVPDLKPEGDEGKYDTSKVGDAASLELLGAEESEKSQESDNSEKSDVSDDSDKDSAEAPESMVSRLLSLAVALLKGDAMEESMLQLFDAAKAHEAIEEARREGEIAGRNATITERMRPAAPTVPSFTGAGVSKMKAGSIFDIAAEAKGSY